MRPPWISEYDEDDYDGQMMSGDRLGLKFPDICLMGEEKPQKNLTQDTCPDRESNPASCNLIEGFSQKKNIKLKIYKTVILPVILYGLFENKLNDLYGKPDIVIRIIKSRRLRWAGHVARMGNEPRMKWENNINHDLREVDYTGDDWKTLAQDRNVFPHGHESTGSIVPVSSKQVTTLIINQIRFYINYNYE
ncbi:hypothetical protein C0J52_24364 [Blattella germanica]|nr:hypothetical protein C0J52_24364 [Blattella germanica]